MNKNGKTRLFYKVWGTINNQRYVFYRYPNLHITLKHNNNITLELKWTTKYCDAYLKNDRNNIK